MRYLVNVFILHRFITRNLTIPYRFQSYAVNHKVSHKNYRESLGIIGIESLSFMCDRMFKIMDKDKDGFILLQEYLNYLDIMLYGSDEEKLK